MKYLSAFFLILAITSCKKTDLEQSPEFPSTLYLNGITKKSKLRLFSDKKEITDHAVISRFLKSSGGFILKDTSFVSDEYIQFFSADSAEIPNSFKSLIVIKNENQLLFKSTNRIITTKEATEKNFTRVVAKA